MRIVVAVLLVFGAANAVSARNLDSEIKRILAKSAIARTGFAGVVVVDEKGRTVVSINSGHLFTPASNTKLFSSALALERLGPDKRFETRVEMRGKDVVLVGTGDANLSGRVLPYLPGSTPGPALAVIDDLAAQIAAHGVQEVEGDIVGDDTAFVYEPYATSWTIEDTVDGDGPASSALVVNDNIVHLRITPSGKVALDPDLPLFHLDAQVTTGVEDKIETNRSALQVRGTVKADGEGYSEEWSVGDPALFAALALKDALVRRGIAVSGSIRALHRDAAAVCPIGQPVEMTRALEESGVLVDGWHGQEEWGRWSSGGDASILLRFAAPLSGPYALEFDMMQPVLDKYVALSVNGSVLPPLAVQEGPNQWDIPESCTNGQTSLRVHLLIALPARPMDVIAGSRDDRVLGVGIRRFRFLVRAGL